MPEFSILETTAEVSVAFAGFIGIFLVLATRDGRFPAVDSFSIRVIVLCSIAPVFYSALPLVLLSLGISGTALWRVSSGLTGLTGIALTAGLVPYYRSLPYGERRPTNPDNLVGWLLSASATLLCLANTLAWPWTPSAGIYLLAVWLVVGIAGMSFVLLIFRRVL